MTYSIILPTGEAVATFDNIEDAVEANRLHRGQSRVVRSDGVAITFPKVPWWRYARPAEETP